MSTIELGGVSFKVTCMSTFKLDGVSSTLPESQEKIFENQDWESFDSRSTVLPNIGTFSQNQHWDLMLHNVTLVFQYCVIGKDTIETYPILENYC